MKKTFQNMTLGEKIEHIWEYYKIAVFGVTAAAALLIYLIVRLMSPKPEVLMNVTMINSNAYDILEENSFRRFLEQEGYDLDSQEINVNAGMYLDSEHMSQSSAASYQALTAMVMVGEIDLLTGDESVFDMLGTNGGLKGMQEILPKHLLEKYRDRLYLTADSETGEEHPCGIWLEGDNPLVKDGYYSGRILAGIPYTAEHGELAEEVLLYLLEGGE